jgi:hypothetical protein
MKSFIYCFLPLFLFCCCKPDKEPNQGGIYENGVFVVNEGIYGQTSGSITFYNPETKSTVQDIFRIANNRDLGNVVQSLFFYNDKAYIVVNNSNKIEVANATDFKEIAQINGLEQPRYFIPISSNRALVSQWGEDLLSGSIALIDLGNNTIIQKITAGIGKGPEQMLLYNDKVYIANVGGLDFDHYISVLNVQTLQVEDTIHTDDAPNSIQLGADGLIWVACKGKAVYSSFPQIDSVQSTYGSLLGIEASNNSVQQRILLEKGRGASNLILANINDLLFLYKGSIYKFNTMSRSYMPVLEGNFYGLGAKPGLDYFYAAVNSGIQAAKVYKISYSGVVKTDSFYAGSFANSILFRN